MRIIKYIVYTISMALLAVAIYTLKNPLLLEYRGTKTTGTIFNVKVGGGDYNIKANYFYEYKFEANKVFYEGITWIGTQSKTKAINDTVTIVYLEDNPNVNSLYSLKELFMISCALFGASLLCLGIGFAIPRKF